MSYKSHCAQILLKISYTQQPFRTISRSCLFRERPAGVRHLLHRKVSSANDVPFNDNSTLDEKEKGLTEEKEKILLVNTSGSNTTDSQTTDQAKSLLKKTVKDVETLLAESSPLPNSKFEDSTFATTPYPEGTVFSKFSQASRSLRPKCDPKETSIILFPGQGTQYVGMGKNLLEFPVAKEMFESASEILGYNLLKVCLEGPMDKLSKTEYCQPAVVVTSLAAIEKLKEERPHALNSCIATAGFSVGEITALIFAGCINFERGIKLIKTRAAAMQYCAEMTPGGMVTLLLGHDSKLTDAIRDAKAHCLECGIEKPECAVSNYLYPSAKVVGGHEPALAFITKNAAKYKIKRVSRLPVSGAFHTRLMAPAADAVKAALRTFRVNDPIIPVHRNIDGRRYKNASHVVTTLPNQVFLPVKWEQTLHTLYERPPDLDFPDTWEVGPGKSLTTLLRKVNAKAADSARNITT